MQHLRRLNIILLAYLFLGNVANASMIDSIRQVLADMPEARRSQGYNKGFHELNAMGNDKDALKLVNEWIDFEHRRGNDIEEGKARWGKMTILSNYDHNEQVLSEGPKQMEWFADHNQMNYYYNTWDCMVNVYLYTDRIQTALEESKRMFEDAQQRDNNFGRVVSYQLSGLIYESMYQYDQAVKYIQRAVDLMEKTDDSNDMLAYLYDYLSQTLDVKGDYARELLVTESWQKTIDRNRAKKNGDSHVMLGTEIACRVQRAAAFIGMNRLDEAEQTLEEANQLLQEMPTPLTEYRVVYVHAHLMRARNMWQESLNDIDSLERMNIAAGGNLDLFKANLLMELGRYQEAAIIFRAQKTEKDSVYNAEMRRQLDNLATLYKIDEIETERDLERTRLWTIIIGIILVALIVFMILRHRASRKLKQKNAELAQKNADLKHARLVAEESSRMKTEFINNISHEIRTPLNILAGFTQIITQPDMKLSDDELADINQRINESTERITGLVQKMLDMSELSSHANIERVDSLTAQRIAEKTIRNTRMETTDSVTFTVKCRPDDAGSTLILTNDHYVVRALSLIIDNARKFTHKGSITLHLKRQEKQMLFIVEDTGIGIDREMSEKIFEEFVQLDKYSDGTGMGLPIARSIARRLGGDVVLDTTYTRGARFILSLPL